MAIHTGATKLTSKAFLFNCVELDVDASLHSCKMYNFMYNPNKETAFATDGDRFLGNQSRFVSSISACMGAS